jgi:hypothetical protein
MSPKMMVQVLLIAALATKIAGAILLADLLVFHIILRAKGLATYDYILATQEAGGSECCGVNTKLIPCVETCSTAPSCSNANISICRALQITSASGRSARWRKNRRKIVPLASETFRELPAASEAAG